MKEQTQVLDAIKKVTEDFGKVLKNIQLIDDRDEKTLAIITFTTICRNFIDQMDKK